VSNRDVTKSLTYNLVVHKTEAYQLSLNHANRTQLRSPKKPTDHHYAQLITGLLWEKWDTKM